MKSSIANLLFSTAFGLSLLIYLAINNHLTGLILIVSVVISILFTKLSHCPALGFVGIGGIAYSALQFMSHSMLLTSSSIVILVFLIIAVYLTIQNNPSN